MWGLQGDFLNALLLLKIIVSMKRCYVGVLGNMEKGEGMYEFCGRVFLKVVKIIKGYA